MGGLPATLLTEEAESSLRRRWRETGRNECGRTGGVKHGAGNVVGILSEDSHLAVCLVAMGVVFAAEGHLPSSKETKR